MSECAVVIGAEGVGESNPNDNGTFPPQVIAPAGTKRPATDQPPAADQALAEGKKITPNPLDAEGQAPAEGKKRKITPKSKKTAGQGDSFKPSPARWPTKRGDPESTAHKAFSSITNEKAFEILLDVIKRLVPNCDPMKLLKVLVATGGPFSFKHIKDHGKKFANQVGNGEGTEATTHDIDAKVCLHEMADKKAAQEFKDKKAQYEDCLKHETDADEVVRLRKLLKGIDDAVEIVKNKIIQALIDPVSIFVKSRNGDSCEKSEERSEEDEVSDGNGFIAPEDADLSTNQLLIDVLMAFGEDNAKQGSAMQQFFRTYNMKNMKK